jgi:hypothetical protein
LLIKCGNAKPTNYYFQEFQDETTELDIWARLNIKMDAIAKSTLIENVLTTQPSRVSYIFGEPWPLWLNGVKVTSYLHAELLTFIGKQVATQYWMKRKGGGSTPFCGD